MEGLISFLFFATLVYGVVIAFQQNGKTSRRSSRRRERNHESSMSATRVHPCFRPMNPATDAVMGALDSTGMLPYALTRYVPSYPLGRAAAARRACREVWLDGSLLDDPGVDWLHVADWLDFHQRGMRTGHEGR